MDHLESEAVPVQLPSERGRETQTSSSPLRPLPPERLYRTADLSALAFETTAEIEGADGHLGQQRALDAIEFPGRYALDTPMSLYASLVFEQSYGGVEGDSASSAELYALLSALAEIPLRQDLAVTGSVNQQGQVQAIGGVNEKIEGFFDICQKRGLSGSQGVLIPSSNVQHLTRDVPAAVELGREALPTLSR